MIYHDLREVYLWNDMKRDITDFVSKCSNCKQFMVEHQKPRGMAQDIDIPTWMWEVINMDFITWLPRTHRQDDFIWIIVDRMTKSCDFIVVKTAYSGEDYANFTLLRFVRVHWLPLSIISY